MISLYGDDNAATPGRVYLEAGKGTIAKPGRIVLRLNYNDILTPTLSVLKSPAGFGSVVIGADELPSNASCNKLYVAGTIGAQEVRVSTTNWCDYVFHNDYKLKPLNEVESFIKTNKHLPEVPSEKEVVENGVAIGEMMKIHMKKIEELTLYMIELKKDNEKLAAEVAGLKK